MNLLKINFKFSQILRLFRERQALHLYTREFDKQIKQSTALYCGYDPTKPSLQIGHLITLLSLVRAQTLGFTPIVLLGGFTGLIGDPSGKNIQRQMIEKKILQQNVANLQIQIRRIYERIIIRLKLQDKLKIINNQDFYKNLSLAQFYSTIGKSFRVGNLIRKQYIQSRLQSQQGISYTQFSYALFQAYDFKCLFQQYSCVLQIGGQDQWGNITSGCDLIKKLLNQQAYGITLNLLVDSNGKKIGKTQGNALFLDSPPKEIYQYFYNISDKDVQKYLLNLSFLKTQQIRQVMQSHNKKPQQRIGQKILIKQILQHLGNHQDTSQKQQSLYKIRIQQLSLEEIRIVFQSHQSIKICRTTLGAYRSMIDILYLAKVRKSKSEIKRDIQMGGIYLNGKRMPSGWGQELDFSQFVFERYALVRFGKRNIALFQMI